MFFFPFLYIHHNDSNIHLNVVFLSFFSKCINPESDANLKRSVGSV